MTPMAGATEQAGWWSRLAHSVIRRPWLYLLGVLLILAVLAVVAWCLFTTFPWGMY